MTDEQTQEQSIVRAHNGDDQQIVLSHRRERCEDLLRACLKGDYTKTPEFAVEVWHFLSESACRQDKNDPVAAAKHLGESAGHLLRVLAEEAAAEENSDESSKSKKAVPSSHQVILLFLAGVFASHPWLWSFATAFFVGHLSMAVNCVPMMKRLEWVTPILVGTHGYVSLREEIVKCMFHMCAWHLVWLWVISQ